jgi:hypothetical protein
MAQGVSRRRYARMWDVCENAVRKAIRVGTVRLHPDGSVDVEASDAIWGRRHALRAATALPIWTGLDPETQARLDAESAELNAWTERMVAEILGSTPRE